MAGANLFQRLLSAAGLGGALSLNPAAAGTGTANAAHARYRPDIDGLRALAVLPVVFYHLKISQVSGGFVGVDVFFVISGYLITSLISAEMHEGTYSVTRFYVRRARRIFPALFFMCAVTALFVLLFCLPSDAKRFSGSLAAATLFASNVYFYITTDYFAAAADTQPLLHTWSLAVEEQFYIVFPLILLLIRRYFAPREKRIMTVLALLSLAISVWLVRTDQQAGAFYLLHSRAWELLLGALLAIGAVPAVRSRALAGALGILGLALIAGSALLYTSQMPFPGLAALAPCIGAALVIHTGGDASLPASRILSIAPVRFIGLISYSLYLWHWPIDVISHYVAFWYSWDAGIRPHRFGVLALSLACAVLSWHFVEKPFRQRPYRLGAAPILSASAAVMAVLVVLSATIYPLSQRFWDIPADAQRALATLDAHLSGSQSTCFLGTKADDLNRFKARCLALSDSKKNWLLIGDSHAADLSVGISAANPDVNLLRGTAWGCKPLLNTTGKARCVDFMRFLFSDFIPKHRFDTILISARWDAAEIDQLRKTAEALKPYAGRIVVIGPHVEYKQDLPWLLAASIMTHNPSVIERSRLLKKERADQTFARKLRDDGIDYVSLYRTICPAERCRVTDQKGLPMAFDYGHLTAGGALYVAKQIKRSGAL